MFLCRHEILPWNRKGGSEIKAVGKIEDIFYIQPILRQVITLAFKFKKRVSRAQRMKFF